MPPIGRPSAPWGGDVITALREVLGITVPIRDASTHISADDFMMVDITIALSTAQWWEIMELVLERENASQINSQERR